MASRYVLAALLAPLSLYGPALVGDGTAMEHRSGAAVAQDTQDPQSQYELARGYLSEGGVRNLQKARELFSKAGDRGHARAAFNAAVMLDQGLGGAQDRKRALLLYQKAANAGDPDAMLTLSKLYDEGVADPKRDPMRSKEWYDRAVESWESGAATGDASLRHPE